MKPLWCVSYGPDDSHMWECKHFDRLRDARDFTSGLFKPYRIYRHTWTHKFSTDGTKTLIEEKLIHEIIQTKRRNAGARSA